MVDGNDGSGTASSMPRSESNIDSISRQIRDLLPGLLLAITLAWIGGWTADFIGKILGFEKSPISTVMLALLLGILVRNIFHLPRRIQSGVSFSVKRVLRLGIILLGIRLTVFDVIQLGFGGIPIVLLCISSGLLITIVISRTMALPRKLGLLIATGTAICGVSAIVATTPAIEAEEEHSAYAITVVTIFGLLATLFYPYLADGLFSGNPIEAGLFLGTSVHDTSQVVGSARVYAEVFEKPIALDTATITKLVRNLFMVLVIPLLAYLNNRSQRSSPQGTEIRFLKLFPLFVLGFLGMAILRSAGDAGLHAGGGIFGLLDAQAWSAFVESAETWANRLLVIALAGVGLNTRLRSLTNLGLQPFFVGLTAALSVGFVSYLAIKLLGNSIL